MSKVNKILWFAGGLFISTLFAIGVYTIFPDFFENSNIATVLRYLENNEADVSVIEEAMFRGLETKLDSIDEKLDNTPKAGYELNGLSLFLLIESTKICEQNGGDFKVKLNEHERIESWNCN